MKRRILFVDDEPLILDGLRHRLHRQRHEWTMRFCGSGKAALELLALEPMDVIVTDMRMPEMDGAELLKQVHARYPQVVRIVLSGHAELQTALRAVVVAHQFLVKPSDAGVIEGTIERACALRSLVDSPAVRQTVGKIDCLPSLPRVYAQLIRAIADERTTTDTVAGILRQDMAICAKTLQVANSAFFRIQRSIAKIEEAVTHLGFNTIKKIVLAVEVFQPTPGRRLPAGMSLEALQRHSLRVAQVAASFFTARQDQEDAFVAGLLHDLGKLVLATEVPEHAERTQAVMTATGCAMHVAEEGLWGSTHAEVGGYLLGLWGLPYPIVEAVANHHAPARVASREFGVLTAAHLANGLVHDELEPKAAGAPTTLDLAYLEQLGVVDRLDGWRAMARRLPEETRP